VSLPLKKRGLDLADIQGNIIRPYGRFGFPFIRHLFFNIGNAKSRPLFHRPGAKRGHHVGTMGGCRWRPIRSASAATARRGECWPIVSRITRARATHADARLAAA